MIRQRPIELLAPAKNLECGIEAINHGADAVYIGAPRFCRQFAGRHYRTGAVCACVQCPYLCHGEYDPA